MMNAVTRKKRAAARRALDQECREALLESPYYTVLDGGLGVWSHDQTRAEARASVAAAARLGLDAVAVEAATGLTL